MLKSEFFPKINHSNGLNEYRGVITEIVLNGKGFEEKQHPIISITLITH